MPRSQNCDRRPRPVRARGRLQIPGAAGRGFEPVRGETAPEGWPALGAGVTGVHLCERDAIVEPELVMGATRERLLASGHYRWQPGRTVREVRAGEAVDHTGARHTGELVIVCTGATTRGYPRPGADRSPADGRRRSGGGGRPGHRVGHGERTAGRRRGASRGADQHSRRGTLRRGGPHTSCRRCGSCPGSSGSARGGRRPTSMPPSGPSPCLRACA